MEYIIREDHVDLQHLYIDGSKFEANANKYTWVWKKATEKSRYRLFEKINKELPPYQRVSRIEVRDTDFERTPSMKIVRYRKCK